MARRFWPDEVLAPRWGWVRGKGGTVRGEGSRRKPCRRLMALEVFLEGLAVYEIDRVLFVRIG